MAETTNGTWYPNPSEPFSQPAEYLAGMKSNAEYIEKGEATRTHNNDTVRSGVFGQSTGLNRNLKSNPFPKIHVIGDSISEDPNGYIIMGGGDRWPDYLANQLDVLNGQKNSRGVNFRGAAESFDGWDRLDQGINRLTWKSNLTSDPLRFYFDNPLDFYEDTIVTLYYVTAPDGGSFTVQRGWTPGAGTVIASGSCNGVAGEVQTLEFTLKGNVQAYLNIDDVNNPVYVYGWTCRRSSVADVDRAVVYNSSLGGRKLTEYTDADIDDTVNAYNADLFIMALGANDYASLVDWATYNTKLQYLITAVENKGATLAFVIQNRNSAADVEGATKTLFEEYVTNLEAIAVSNNYCCINMDSIWGGYTKAAAKGLLLDTIHPNSYGHLCIGQVVSNALLGYYYNVSADREGVQGGHLKLGNVITTDTIVPKDTTTVRTTTPAYQYQSHNLQVGGSCLKAELPFLTSELWVGFQMYVTDENRLYICSQIDPSVQWRYVDTVAAV
jgi:hypothetical protein